MTETPIKTVIRRQLNIISLFAQHNLDVNGMMRHILDCLGALKVRLSEEIESPALINVFGGAVTI